MSENTSGFLAEDGHRLNMVYEVHRQKYSDKKPSSKIFLLQIFLRSFECICMIRKSQCKLLMCCKHCWANFQSSEVQQRTKTYTLLTKGDIVVNSCSKPKISLSKL